MPDYRFPAEESAIAPPNATTLGHQVYGTLREEILTGAMKPGSRLDSDTARGSIVEEGALFDTLAAGRIAGAALDVYQHEPYVPADPAKDLRRLGNAVLTPHIGLKTREANQRMALASLANVIHFLAGRYDSMSLVTSAK